MIREKLKAFQGVRGLAILLIMLSHTALIKGADGNSCLGHLGGAGVELFLLLSGFLTCYWHLDEPIVPKNFKDSILYAIKKIKKYYLLHIATLLLAIPFVGKALFCQIDFWQWLKLAVNVLLLQSWVPMGSVYFSFNAVSWYLSVMVFLLLVSSCVLYRLKYIKVKQCCILLLAIGLSEFLLAGIAGRLPMEKTAIHWLVYVFPFVRLMDFVCGGVSVLVRKTKPDINGVIHKYGSTFLIIIYMAIMIL